MEVNIVRSAYGKANDKVINWLTKRNATCINDKKVADYLASSSAPIADAPQGSEPFDDAKVQRNSELAKFLGEKLYIRTKNFKDFFGDWENDPEHSSKVFDENGEPRVMYHGTRNGVFYGGFYKLAFDDFEAIAQQISLGLQGCSEPLPKDLGRKMQVRVRKHKR